MSSDAATHPDPALPADTKAVAPVDASKAKALSILPRDVTATLSKADELLLRLSKMIKTTAGLSAFLSTLNYALYLLAYIHINAPTRAAIIEKLSTLIGRTPAKIAPGALNPALGVSALTPLGALVSDLRTSLRLTGLLPMYVWMKSLLNRDSAAKMDPTLHKVALLQCSSYIAFQALENVTHLVGKGVLPGDVVAKRGGAAAWVRWSCRAWLVGVACDVLRLVQEARLEGRRASSRTKTAAEKDEYDRKWWAEFMVAVYWLPVAAHYSLYPDGIKGMNQGVVGFLGFMAGLNNFRNAWAATK